MKSTLNSTLFSSVCIFKNSRPIVAADDLSSSRRFLKALCLYLLALTRPSPETSWIQVTPAPLRLPSSTCPWLWFYHTTCSYLLRTSWISAACAFPFPSAGATVIIPINMFRYAVSPVSRLRCELCSKKPGNTALPIIAVMARIRMY
jgi:hypothetical protein